MLLLDRLVEYAREQAAFSAWSEAYGFDATSNAEIRFRWLVLALVCHDPSRVDAAITMALEVGRMKFTRPLYRELMCLDHGRKARRSTGTPKKRPWAECSSLVLSNEVPENRISCGQCTMSTLDASCPQFLQMDLASRLMEAVLHMSPPSVHAYSTAAKAASTSCSALSFFSPETEGLEAKCRNRSWIERAFIRSACTQAMCESEQLPTLKPLAARQFAQNGLKRT